MFVRPTAAAGASDAMRKVFEVVSSPPSSMDRQQRQRRRVRRRHASLLTTCTPLLAAARPLLRLPQCVRIAPSVPRSLPSHSSTTPLSPANLTITSRARTPVLTLDHSWPKNHLEPARLGEMPFSPAPRIRTRARARPSLVGTHSIVQELTRTAASGRPVLRPCLERSSYCT